MISYSIMVMSYVDIIKARQGCNFKQPAAGQNNIQAIYTHREFEGSKYFGVKAPINQFRLLFSTA